MIFFQFRKLAQQLPKKWFIMMHRVAVPQCRNLLIIAGDKKKKKTTINFQMRFKENTNLIR